MKQKTHIDIKDDDAHFDLVDKTTYSEYLQLDKVLSAQAHRSTAHDEHMFIIIHQVSELWLSLALHEMTEALKLIRDDQLDVVFKILSRVSKLQQQLAAVWDVVSTLTPADYLSFRNSLGHASGFQSYQYRMLEFSLGNKSKKLAEVFAYDSTIHERALEVLNSPSIYDETIRLLARRGFDLPPSSIERDWSLPYEVSDSVLAAWKTIYTQTDLYWDLYELAEKLVDVEDQFQRWRFRHFKSVERLIGNRPGTGGTCGASFLEQALQLRFFPELYQVRTWL